MAITFPTVFQSAISTDPAATAAGYLTPTRYNQGVAIAGLSATSGALLYSTSATVLAQSAGLLWNTTGAAGEGLALAAGTAGSAVQALSVTQTANFASAYDVTKTVVTETSFNASSNYYAIYGGASGTQLEFAVAKGGAVLLGGTSALRLNHSGTAFEFGDQSGGRTCLLDTNTSVVTFSLRSDGAFGFCATANAGGTIDTVISRVGAGVLGVGLTATGQFTGRLKLTSVITAAVAVGSLNTSPTIGEVQTVNDALAVAAKGATVSAGGTAVCQVMWNGSNWVGT